MFARLNEKALFKLARFLNYEDELAALPLLDGRSLAPNQRDVGLTKSMYASSSYVGAARHYLVRFSPRIDVIDSPFDAALIPYLSRPANRPRAGARRGRRRALLYARSHVRRARRPHSLHLLRKLSTRDDSIPKRRLGPGHFPRLCSRMTPSCRATRLARQRAPGHLWPGPAKKRTYMSVTVRRCKLGVVHGNRATCSSSKAVACAVGPVDGFKITGCHVDVPELGIAVQLG